MRNIATPLINPKDRAMCDRVEEFKHELDWAKTKSLGSALALADSNIMRQVNESVERGTPR
jgi:hypothetical protein